MLVLLAAVESLGIPLPGEAALVTAASVAALGNLSIYGGIFTAAVAAST
jgi:membrane protein DedA with SNARE-associated domain